VLDVVVGGAFDEPASTSWGGLTGVPATGGWRFCRDVLLLGHFRNFPAVWECHLQFFDPVSSGPIFPELAERRTAVDRFQKLPRFASGLLKNRPPSGVARLFPEFG
jgi:hypothetical protein